MYTQTDTFSPVFLVLIKPVIQDRISVICFLLKPLSRHITSSALITQFDWHSVSSRFGAPHYCIFFILHLLRNYQFWIPSCMKDWGFCRVHYSYYRNYPPFSTIFIYHQSCFPKAVITKWHPAWSCDAVLGSVMRARWVSSVHGIIASCERKKCEKKSCSNKIQAFPMKASIDRWHHT